jgi:hypothetical protein
MLAACTLGVYGLMGGACCAGSLVDTNGPVEDIVTCKGACSDSVHQLGACSDSVTE